MWNKLWAFSFSDISCINGEEKMQVTPHKILSIRISILHFTDKLITFLYIWFFEPFSTIHYLLGLFTTTTIETAMHLFWLTFLFYYNCQPLTFLCSIAPNLHNLIWWIYQSVVMYDFLWTACTCSRTSIYFLHSLPSHMFFFRQ